MIYPAATQYLSELSMANNGMAELGIEMDNTIALTIANETNAMLGAVAELSTAIKQHDFDSIEAHMNFCANDIRNLMVKVRTHVDALEAEIADELWPLPKYREMLFIK